jgi:hypothetical protein
VPNAQKPPYRPSIGRAARVNRPTLLHPPERDL